MRKYWANRDWAKRDWANRDWANRGAPKRSCIGTPSLYLPPNT